MKPLRLTDRKGARSSEGEAPEQWWAFYVRVTSEESVKKDLSIPNQCSRAREIAAARGWHNYRIYIEERHASAELWADKRPAFKRMLDDVQAGHVLGVCARHTDRLWRGTEIQGRLLRVLRAYGVELWDFNSRYDYKRAHGRFSLQVLGAASELEVGLVAERIREMKRGKALKGKVGGGVTLFGYTSQARRIKELQASGCSPEEAYRRACVEYPIGKWWYIDEAEAQIVRLIFDLYTNPAYRFGSKRIALYLNQRGYRTRSGQSYTFVRVMKIVNNPTYAGFTTYDEDAYKNRMPSQRPRREQTFYKGEHPALVTPEVWYKAQEIKVSENSVKRQREGESTAGTFSLTGMMYCPRCGQRMIGKASCSAQYRYYMCLRRHLSGTDACDFPTLRAVELQTAVWRWIHDVLSSPAFVMPQLERLRRKLEAEQPKVEQQLKGAMHGRDKIKASLAKYFRMFEASTDQEPEAGFVERVRELRAELATVEAEVAELGTLVTPRRKLSAEHVERYMAMLRERVEQQANYQRALFHELQREHDLRVCLVSPTELTVSLTLPTTPEDGADAGQKRVFSVLAGGRPRVGSKVPSSQVVGLRGAIQRANASSAFPERATRNGISSSMSGSSLAATHKNEKPIDSTR